jgi:hypothetical protein
MFAGELAYYDRQRIRQHVAPNPADSTRRRDAIGLAIASPSFQWY